ncbi:MAG: signal peptidase I [Actinobacteria bacterium]|nr:signal peptidase I [Actinomycetota bacterium]
MLKRLSNGIFLITIIAIIGSLGFVATGAIKADIGLKDIKSLRPLVVLTGSMHPAMGVGSLALMQELNPSGIERIVEGDVVTFRNPEDPTKIITHRIVDVKERDGHRIFKTKGDANEGVDSWAVTPGAVVGKVGFSIPYLGYALSFIKTKKGYVLLVLIPALLIILSESRKIIGHLRKDNRKDNSLDSETPSDGTATKATALLLCALLTSFSTVQHSYAVFTDSKSVYAVPFRAASFDDAFMLTVGRAKAIRHPRINQNRPVVFPIASVDELSALSLDFGHVPPGNSNNSPDVFRVKNIFDGNLRITAEAEGAIAPLIDRISFSRRRDDRTRYVMTPGEEVSVNIKLGAATDIPEGIYTGYIKLEALNGFFLKKIPAVVEVVSVALRDADVTRADAINENNEPDAIGGKSEELGVNEPDALNENTTSSALNENNEPDIAGADVTRADVIGVDATSTTPGTQGVRPRYPHLPAYQ